MVYDWPCFTVRKKPDAGQVLAPICNGVFYSPAGTIFLITSFNGKTYFAYSEEKKQFIVAKDLTAETPKPTCPRCKKQEFAVQLRDLQKALSATQENQIYTCLNCTLRGYIHLKTPTGDLADIRWEFEPIEHGEDPDDWESKGPYKPYDPEKGWP